MQKRYVYYLPYRPPAPGTHPIYGLADLNDFGEKMYVREINREAWGKLVYKRKLSDQEVYNWELVPGKEFDLDEL